MSSLYYANALFSKYPAAGSVFAAGAFPEQTSCAFAASPQRPGYGAGSGAPFAAASVPGLYPGGGGGLAGQGAAAGVYAAGYGLEPGSFNMHCAPFEQSLSGGCPGEAAKEQRDADLAAESNFRIYPWMRSSGNAAHRAAPAAGARAQAPGGAPFPAQHPCPRPQGSPAPGPAGGGPWGRGAPLGRAPARRLHPSFAGRSRAPRSAPRRLALSPPTAQRSALGSPSSPPTLALSLLALNIYQPRPQRPAKRPFVLRRKAGVCRE